VIMHAIKRYTAYNKNVIITFSQLPLVVPAWFSSYIYIFFKFFGVLNGLSSSIMWACWPINQLHNG
jgi:hypothetical protein